MQKNLLLFIAIIGLGLTSQGQTTIPNADFETWLNIGAATERPTNWNSNKTGGGLASFGPQTCFRDTGSYSASYCMKIVTGSAFGTIVNGSGTTGKVEAPTAVKAEGYIHTIAGDPNFSSAFVGRPDSIVFWYKYAQVGLDYPKIETRLHVGNCYVPETPVNSNHLDSTMNIVARALWSGAAANQAIWKRVSVPMVYSDTRTPQYILVTMTSSGDQNGGAAGSTLWVDYMQAIYNTTGIADIATEAVPVFWNGNRIVADLSATDITGTSLQLINMSGQLVLDQHIATHTVNSIDTDVPAGVYVYRLVSEQRTIVGKIGR